MTQHDSHPALPDDAIEPAPDDEFDLTDYDRAIYVVLYDAMDYVAQYLAIRDLLKRQHEADHLLKTRIIEADDFARRTRGIVNEHAIDEYIEHAHASVFQHAAHSMSALGMLAPLIESPFYYTFIGIQRRIIEIEATPHDNTHPRWLWNPQKQWDCYYHLGKNNKPQKDIVKGILELSAATGLSKHMPPDLQQLLQALFSYRNSMFHCGFEWPIRERQKFSRKLSKWSADWFDKSTRSNEPWIFYLTETFIEKCFTTIDDTLSGIGAFARELSDAFPLKI